MLTISLGLQSKAFDWTTAIKNLHFSEVLDDAGFIDERDSKESWSVPKYPHLRNAAASDWKRAGLCEDEISAALGHCVNKTSSNYGQHQIGQGSGGLCPFDIKAARTVLQTRSPTPGVAFSQHQNTTPSM